MILDFIFIAIVLCAVVIGYSKGFSQMLISLLALFLSIFFAFTIFNWVGEGFLHTEFGQSVHQNISERIDENFRNKSETAIESIPYLASLVKLSSDDDGIIDFSELSQKIASRAVKAIIIVILMILSLFLSKFAVFLLRKIAFAITSLPIINGIDSLLGAISGFLFGILSVAVLFTLISYIQFIPVLESLQKQFDSSIIVLLINDFFF